MMRNLGRMAILAVVMLAIAACGRVTAGDAAPRPAVPAASISFGPLKAVYPNATTVRMYVPGSFDGKARKTPLEGVTLSQDQVKRLRAAISRDPPPEAYAACFVPHHFFRFYDSRGSKVGELSVCLCCSGIQADPTLLHDPNSELGFDYWAVADIIRELGYPINIDCDEDIEADEKAARGGAAFPSRDQPVKR